MSGKDGTGSSRGGVGRMQGNRQGAGPSGNCTCPNCGNSIAHQKGVPCYSVKCPKCQSAMTRA